MKALRILIADDHDLMRRGIKGMLQSHAGWEVCGEAHTGREAVAMAQELKPDIVVLDISMPDLNGVDAARKIRKDSPSTEILILSVHYSDQLIRDILEAGVRGYIVKSDSDRDTGNSQAISYLARDRSDADKFQRGKDAPGASHISSRSAHIPRARNCAVTGRGQEQQRSRVVAQYQRKDSRNPPREYHAQTAVAYRQRIGSVCGTKSNRRSVTVPFLPTCPR